MQVIRGIHILLLLCAFVLGALLQVQLRRGRAASSRFEASSGGKIRLLRSTEMLSAKETDATVNASAHTSAPDASEEIHSDTFRCSDSPHRCGFVYMHCSMNATVHASVHAKRQAEFGWWSAVLSAARLRQLIGLDSPVVLITNYEESLIDELRMQYTTRATSDGVEERLTSLERDEAFVTGGGQWDSSAFEPLHSPLLPPMDERGRQGARQLADATAWPFSHVLTFPHATSASAVHVMKVKSDALRYLLPVLNSTSEQERSECRSGPFFDDRELTSSHASSAGRQWTTLCLQVSRWLFLDGDTMAQQVDSDSWAGELDGTATALNGSVPTLLTPVDTHIKAETRQRLRADASAVSGDRRRRGSPRLLFNVMDLLQSSDVVMVPELNSQRDAGPRLYGALLQDVVFPNDDDAAGYRYSYTYERQYNTGFIAFRSAAVVREFFELWSSSHREVQRCLEDRVAWDQCSLPLALRRSTILRVSPAWEVFNARDALGQGCSTLLYSNTMRNFRMIRETAVVLHRRSAKHYVRRLMFLAWGDTFMRQCIVSD